MAGNGSHGWISIYMVSQQRQLLLPMITAGDCGKGDDLATAVCGWIGRNHHIQPVDNQTVAFFVCYQTSTAFLGFSKTYSGNCQ